MNKTGIPEYAVLMAGGGGTRLWPLSRPGHPKQLLRLLGGKSLYALTIERLLGVFPLEHIFVVSNAVQLPLLRSHEPRLPEGNYLCEPGPRNTAPAVVYALAELRKREPEFLMACLPADHFIANAAEFRGLVQTAGRLADQGQIVTLGIHPSGPETGYGYLELGDELASDDEFQCRKVRRFKEKPTADEAVKMIAQGGYAWNSGMFFWRSDVIEGEIRRQQPVMAEVLDRLVSDQRPLLGESKFEKLWNTLPALSLDYAIMEKASAVSAVITRNLGWMDIGSWDALLDLYRMHPELEPEQKGFWVDVESNPSLSVFRDSSSMKVLATVGLDDLIIVETDDALLICRKGKSQGVRMVVERLKSSPAMEMKKP